MPRIRTVKPEIHQDEAVGVVSDSAFRLFIGLITLADDYGRLKGGLGLLNSQVWPYAPKPLEEVDQLLDELASEGLIWRYEVDGKPYVCLPSWEHHQRIDNAGKSRIPGPDKAPRGDSPRDSVDGGDSRLDQGGERKGPRNGAGGETAADAASASHIVESVIAKCEQVAFAHSLPSPSVDAVAEICRQFAGPHLEARVAKFAHYRTGPAAGRDIPGRDVVWALRVWLETERDEAPKVSRANPRGSVGADVERLAAEAERLRAEEARA